MTALRLILIACVLPLLFPVLAYAQTDACRQFLMQHDELRQLYARGDGMSVRVPPVSKRFARLTATGVHEVAVRKLRSSGLYEPDARQWLQISLNMDAAQFAIFLSLRRWSDDLGYGLPGESTVWGLGGGGQHRGSAGRVLVQVAQHMDEFITLYERAQRTCTM